MVKKMSNNSEQRVNHILKERASRANAAPSLQQRYLASLIMDFPESAPVGELFLKNTFSGDDRLDYLRFEKIFKNKTWKNVNFHDFYVEYVQFNYLNTNGQIYYLPGFLNFFFDLKNQEIEQYTYFLAMLHNGLINFNEENIEKLHNQEKIDNDYSVFSCLSHSQSRLISQFLVNVSNLSHDSYDVKVAQDALTNYWGNFLLY